MFKEELMDHFKFPRNKKKVESPDFSSKDEIPSCGDKVYISGKFEGEKISDLGFDGVGCVLCMGSASMLTEFFIGKSFGDVLVFSKDDLLKLLQIELGPVRVKCAMLALLVMQEAIKKTKKIEEKVR